MRYLRVFFVAILWLMVAASASAHEGGSAVIIVSGDHILPGRQFEVVAADMGPGADVAFQIAHQPRVVQLGTIVAGADGHFVATLSLPADFPLGYAELSASAATAAQASTWILVGERTDATSPLPTTGQWWADPSVLVLLVLLSGAAAVIAVLLLRPRRE